VGFDNVFDQAQANADALRFPAQLRAAPIKSLKDLGVLGGWDSRPVI